jgi:hypothetical protein
VDIRDQSRSTSVAASSSRSPARRDSERAELDVDTTDRSDAKSAGQRPGIGPFYNKTRH